MQVSSSDLCLLAMAFPVSYSTSRPQFYAPVYVPRTTYTRGLPVPSTPPPSFGFPQQPLFVNGGFGGFRQPTLVLSLPQHPKGWRSGTNLAPLCTTAADGSKPAFTPHQVHVGIVDSQAEQRKRVRGWQRTQSQQEYTPVELGSAAPHAEPQLSAKPVELVQDAADKAVDIPRGNKLMLLGNEETHAVEFEEEISLLEQSVSRAKDTDCHTQDTPSLSSGRAHEYQPLIDTDARPDTTIPARDVDTLRRALRAALDIVHDVEPLVGRGLEAHKEQIRRAWVVIESWDRTE